MEAVGDQDTDEPVEERQEIASRSIKEEQTGTEKIVEAEVPLVRKKRKLMKARESELAPKRVVAESIGPGRDKVDQGMIKPSVGEGMIVVCEEGQVTLPLVLVPFEAVPDEEPQA